MHIVALDSGTTSSRAWSLDDGEVVGRATVRAGARDVATGEDRSWLEGQVRDVIERAISEARGSGHDDPPDAVVAFGMITSELGLEEVPHLVAPVTMEDLGHGLRRRERSWAPAPLYLVPGVRCESESLARNDFMRGEETQVAGLLATGRTGPLLVISSGSHTKFVVVDAEDRISWSLTTLSGELLWALHRETILGPLIDPRRTIEDIEAVQLGAEMARGAGLSRALFAARLYRRLMDAPPESCSDLLLGAIASADLASLESVLTEKGPPPVVLVLGEKPLSEAYRYLLEDIDWAEEVEVLTDQLGPAGALSLYGFIERSDEG